MGSGKGKTRRASGSQPKLGAQAPGSNYATARECINDTLTNAKWFGKDYVEKHCAQSKHEVDAELKRMIESGELREDWNLVCPETGRTFATLDADEALKLHKSRGALSLNCRHCETGKHVFTAMLFHNTYSPAKEGFSVKNL